MNGSAGSSRQKGRKQEIAELNGAVPASKAESEGPVVGLVARIVEIISSGIHSSRFRCPLWIRRGSHTFTR
jgi:hypothetical protein